MMKRFYLGCWGVLGLLGAAACADNGRDVGYLFGAGGQSLTSSSAAGGTGGSTSNGGSPSGGGAPRGSGGESRAGAAGASTGTGGKPGTGGMSPGSGGSGGGGGDAAPPNGDGGSPPERDAATDSGGLPLCGGTPCLSTTCVGLGCGVARCCKTDTGPVCVRGATRCPGEPAEVTLQCWRGAPLPATATFDKTCKVDGDCIVVEHWNGCCSLSAVGVAATQKASVDTFEQQTCGGPPPCGCCCNRINAEDGSPVVPPATGKPICWNGACMAVMQ